MKRCSSCDAENPAGAKFCLECGLPFARAGDGSASPAWRGARRGRAAAVDVFFCDIVNSVELAERLDPEELRETMAAYHRVCLSVFAALRAIVHDFSGDGIMVYFGFPSAHEDDVLRAVRSGLGIVEAMSRLNGQIQDGQGVDLHVRIGIDTGLVVAGAVGVDEGLEARRLSA